MDTIRTYLTNIYLSNIAPGWSFARQEALLDERLPGWRRGAVFRDEMTLRRGRTYLVGGLPQREEALRRTTRATTSVLHVATLPVIAWGPEDFSSLCGMLATANIAIFALDTGTRIEPGDEISHAAAIEEFVMRRKAASEQAARLAGTAASAAKRHARIADGCRRIRDRWGMPSTEHMWRRWGLLAQLPEWKPEWRTKNLLAEAGAPGKPLAYNSVASELGLREETQRQFKAILEGREQ